MRRFLFFLAIGSIFATLGEFLFCVLVRGSPSGYAFTLFAYPVLLTPAYALSRVADRVLRAPAAADLVYDLAMGTAGLMIEWFWIGNSPWANPSANQIGMFAFWATVFTMPRLLLAGRAELTAWRRTIAWSFGVFSAASILIGLLLPAGYRLFVLVWLVVVGYVGMELQIGAAIWITAHSERLSPVFQH